ncbi:probable dolichyl pyrophosphate Man9GlcNAc2 alpha-1,3-glucosyltransferase isoform X2 [Amaranthus tricolor]|uniref:probable dolichyl pyrophosphate Man9GlcNAc2 alpha-1,3-glucosyltransferase isoform X2 n=1 Tax=Amaranthus tricolor TaxID=29722 RepID=UPI00258FB1D1|nr:probable dolichyl pyrophosphate Man9GlcNAc2 alpha-1,3-glucosyltransferase isoform X2 [Amaranthus tricolor]
MGSKKERKVIIIDTNSQPWWWLLNKGLGASFLCISLFALLVRLTVSLHPYSGAGNPPKFGDFEAQRHWMEITINLPVKEWYRNSTANDLSYWGLDYPPLTGYQSYVHGIILKSLLPESVSLFTSHGYESYLGFASSVLLKFGVLNSCEFWLIKYFMFQFNCISLGLTIGAVAAIFSNRELVASALFTLALSHKQMSAYFAPAFFSHLLGRCLRRRNPFVEVSKLALVVMGTFAIVWWPYLQSKEALLEVLARLAPFERGIYEDYVANFWCTTSVLIKWKKLFDTQSLKLLSLVATVSTCLPSMVQQIKYPSNKGFLFALINSSLSFYFFSFQVHEKSILLPLLPASLLALEETHVYKWLTHFGLVSMFPLLCRDQLVLAYIALFVLFYAIYFAPNSKNSRKIRYTTLPLMIKTLVIILSFILHIVYLTMSPPKRYPFLFEAIIMILCFSQFVWVAIYTNTKQWMLHKSSTSIEKEKKYL